MVEKLIIEPKTGMQFVQIPSGYFVKGKCGTDPEIKHSPEEIRVEGFWMGRYLVTQGEWKTIMGDNPSYFSKGVEGYNLHSIFACDQISQMLRDAPSNISDYSLPESYKVERNPVECVSWVDVQNFISKLSNKKFSFRLPTETEWEYACKAGTNTSYNLGDTIDPSQANFSPSNETREWYFYEEPTTVVGHFSPNSWGLYDMHGNVNEWCNDKYLNLDEEMIHKGKHWRVIRGGSWDDPEQALCSTFQGAALEESRSFTIGFRLVCYETYP